MPAALHDRRERDGVTKDERAATSHEKKLAELWRDATQADYFLTATFNEWAHVHFKLNTPERTIEFGQRVLKDAGYYGPHVIVAHDNRGTKYYHLHMLLCETNEMEAIRAAFKKLGNIQSKQDGPVRDFGAFVYCAIRASVGGRPVCERWDMQNRWRRRPRPRGRGGRDA